ncbi:MAG TPA: hypothetical protein VFJ85_00465 [Acidimicrobiales bacterium]|nr:hypothetical protein [Acidimicrobiales bacterium]
MGLRDRFRPKRRPEDAFADEVAELITDLLPVTSVERGPEFTLSVSFEDGRTSSVFLGMIYAEAMSLEGHEREERVRRAVLAMAPAPRPATWADAEGRLLPAVRGMSWAAAAGGGEAQPLWRPFLPFLVLLAAIDADHGMSFVMPSDLRGWGVDADAVAARARENLVEGGMPVVQSDDRQWVEVSGPEGYVASWLSVPDMLGWLGADVFDGNFVAVAPSRDRLRLVSTADRITLRHELERALADYEAAPRQLSPVPYAISEGEIAPWRPPPGDPCRPVVDRAGLVVAAVEYGFQQRTLASLFEKSGEDVFVAQLNAMERADGSVWSWAAWVRQVTDGLLPRADYVALIDNEADTTFWVRWEDAERIVPGALCQDAGYYPARWRVAGWPEGSALEELRAVAVPAPGR